MDETFHLTPLDVRRYDFGRALRGYDPQRVEQFREQVATELERLTKQTVELDSKAKGFHEQLRAFRDRDKALNDALVSAQQLREEIRESSQHEAELIVREARIVGEQQVEAARAEVRKLETHLVELDRARRAHLAQLRLMTERQLAEITAAEQAPMPLAFIAREAAKSGPTFPPAPAAAGSHEQG